MEAPPPPFLWPWSPETKCPLWVRKPSWSPPLEPSSMAFPPWCCACSAPGWSERRSRSRLQKHKKWVEVHGFMTGMSECTRHKWVFQSAESNTWRRTNRSFLTEFDWSVHPEKYVVALDVSVDDLVGMKKLQSLKDLKREQVRKWSELPNVQRLQMQRLAKVSTPLGFPHILWRYNQIVQCFLGGFYVIDTRWRILRTGILTFLTILHIYSWKMGKNPSYRMDGVCKHQYSILAT